MTSREVELTGGAPWGFRMHGGLDQNQPLRISRVNPGRKASLSGIREGDVITSINGHPTKNMTNSEAHAMLRSAGPSLRLGLNEDKEMSPRRRSIGKATELKRPSQLLSDIYNGKAELHAPVYATIRPPHKPTAPPLRSLSSPSTSTTQATEEPPKIHPTNPFYTTLPSNYTSASKLPVPNGRLSFSNLDRNNTINKSKDSINSYDSNAYLPNYTESNSQPERKPVNITSDTTSDSQNIDSRQQYRNPFEAKRNSDPFEKYLRPESQTNGARETSMLNSKSDTDFFSKEEITKHSITEEKISEIEEVKTIKKIVLNGSSESSNGKNANEARNSFDTMERKENTKNEYIITPTLENYDNYFYKNCKNGEGERLSSSVIYKSPGDRFNSMSPKVEIQTGYETNAPVKSPSGTLTPSPTSKPVWTPGAPAAGDSAPRPPAAGDSPRPPPPPPPPVWTPSSATASPQTPRKTFRPVHFEESPPARRKFDNTEQNGCTSGSESESRLRTSHSAPVTGFNSLGSRLPKAQNPTVTLLQKAREGQLARSPNQDRDSRLPRDRPSPPSNDPIHALRRGYVSEGEGERRERDSIRKMADAQKKIEGIGPITKDGMPVALRSEVKDPSRWYKKMYDTIHKNKYDNDYVTIRYKSRKDEPQRVSSSRSQYAYFDPRSGYLSEPEGGLSRLTSGTWSDAYDSDVNTGPRRRTASVQEDRRHDSSFQSTNKFSTLASTKASHEVYKSQPGKIENYTPGKSSVVDKEAKQWWDEVMDIFDGWLDDNSPLPPYSTLLARAIQKNQNISSTTSLPASKEKKDLTSTILSKSNMARALKESGYESDSTLVFKRREETEAPLSPAERRAAYRDLQAGGEPPLRGFRSPAPPRTEESEIEYIPISPTLTKIRVHKRSPVAHEVICYPITNIESNVPDQLMNIWLRQEKEKSLMPPAPPRRISSRSSRTLQLVTAAKPRSVSPKRVTGKVNIMKEKINTKLNRQNTHLIVKNSPSINIQKRNASTSAPPVLNRHKIALSTTSTKRNIETIQRSVGTSSFGSPRKTMPPTEYTTPSRKKCDKQNSVIIHGGVGRKTPITNVLDKITPLDKLWSAQKRNERIDLSKLKYKNEKQNTAQLKPITTSSFNSSNKPSITIAVPHKSRDMTRTSEKMQKLKSSVHAQSTPCLVNKQKQHERHLKTAGLKNFSNVSKSTLNISTCSKKSSSNIKTAIINNSINKKKSIETVIKPKVGPCYEHCNKNKSKVIPCKEKIMNSTKDLSKKVVSKTKISNNTFSNEFGDNIKIDTPQVNQTRNAMVRDTFFQNLFFRNVEFPTLDYSDSENISSVKEKARFFQSNPSNILYHTPSAVNTYLIHRKPVSLSRFKMWDRNPSPTRIWNPRSISWPGRMDGKIKKFESLEKCEGEFGSCTSLSSTRSKSEPPSNKLYFSQTSRPKSPIIEFKKNINSPCKIVHVIRNESKLKQSVQSCTPNISSYSEMNSAKNNRDCYASTLFFSQTSRPVSPIITKKTNSTKSRSLSTSPIPMRSPSSRRIHNVKSQQKSVSVLRPRSLDSSEKKIIIPSLKTKSKSDTITQCDPEYEEYIEDIQNAKKRSDRFRELNRYYSYLERVGELEKATSITDLRHRRRDEDIIDFDRWKKIRAIERAEEELNNLYEKLKVAQIEKDFLFYPRDVKDFRWNYENERGLKIKEKSVEDLKDDFLVKSSNTSPTIQNTQSKDVYKPLWRGTTVAETAQDINKKSEAAKSPTRCRITKPASLNKDLSLSELRKKIGIGNRLWSSLSLEQVNTLKNQLNAIYSKELDSKNRKDLDNFTVEVKEKTKDNNTNLHVRCSSLTTSKSECFNSNEITKSESIAAICPLATEKEFKNNVNKMQMTLSESEKRKISQTLSKEVIQRIKSDTKNDDNTVINIIKTKENNNNSHIDRQLDNKRHVVYISDKDEPSASETETGGSDVSSNTVIYVPSKKDVQKMVEYFESVKNVPQTDHSIASSIVQKSEEKLHVSSNLRDDSRSPQTISQSQSCTDIKELFGESEKNKFLSLPLKPDLYSRSPSPLSEVYLQARRTPDTLRFSSDETIWRSRSPSPDPERYWRAYLKLARAGEVRRLARRFDSPTAAGAVLRRHRSDPEINSTESRNCLCSNKSLSHREKCKTSYTVARVPLKSTNRFMPHIDIISKLAALRRRNTPRSRSAEEALECRPGEVERIRKRFEVMSLLGQIYSSAPDVSELKDIAPYLEGSWIAHRYPKPSDNNRSINDPKSYVRGRLSPVKREIKRAVLKEPLKLSSILKNDETEISKFDPSVHRPISRYEPPRAPPRPPPAAWPYKLAPFVTPSRHTVTFQETDCAPEPPRRMQHSSFSDSESPSRRYVESDVNIHYRCPVRHDPLPLVPERELARQQAEHMKRLYREQKRNKYLQELQDMQSRRHQDNFTPSQKTIVPLNRYDEAEKIIARALYTFNGQTARELSFRKGDIINVRRQIDNNWYEGEIHGRIGLFPYNYVELLKGDIAQSSKKPVVLEGRARAKFDFTAQTNLELPLKKGELVVLTRRIDHNWWEGRIGNRTGIFPDSYVTVLQEPSQSKPEPQPILSTNKPVSSPAAHGLVNGDKQSLGAHRYTPQHNSPALANAPPATSPLPGYPVKSSQPSGADRGYNTSVNLNNTEPLYVDTNAEAVPYRAMYKYRPQNPDELELNEGDTVYVLEKCDDGWYVGSSQRSGRFGTFPGNYVERI